MEKKRTATNGRKSHVSEAATELWHEGQKFASELYEEGLQRMNEAQKSIKIYSDEALETVQRKPLTSILVAAGVGFVLSAILRRR